MSLFSLLLRFLLTPEQDAAVQSSVNSQPGYWVLVGLSRNPQQCSHSLFPGAVRACAAGDGEKTSCASAGAQRRASRALGDVTCKSSSSSCSGKLPAVRRDTAPAGDVPGAVAGKSPPRGPAGPCCSPERCAAAQPGSVASPAWVGGGQAVW